MGQSPTSQRMCRTFIEVAALSFPPPYVVHLTEINAKEMGRHTFESSVLFPPFGLLVSLPVFLGIGPIGLRRFVVVCQHVAAPTSECVSLPVS